MTETLGMAAQLASNTARFGWYWGINWLMTREAKHHAGLPPIIRRGPFPPTRN